MPFTSIQMWADSLGKGVVYDDIRKRYVILKDRCAVTLQEALGIPIVNHSRMGMTVVDGYQEFLQNGEAGDSIAVIAYGGNDCDLPWKDVAENPGRVYEGFTPIERFCDTLELFVKKARARGMKPLLVTPVPLEAQRYFDWVTSNLSKEVIMRFLGDVSNIYRWQERYSIAVRKVAEATRTTLFDMRDAFLADRNYPALMCTDGIHPNADGHALITRSVLLGRARLADELR